jgi:hypothetical protein
MALEHEIKDMLEKKVITEKSEPLVLTGDTRVQA